MVFLYNSDYKRLILQYDKRNIGKAKNISQRLWEYEKEYSVTSNQKWSALYTDFCYWASCYSEAFAQIGAPVTIKQIGNFLTMNISDL